jgi:hypothetical protein
MSSGESCSVLALFRKPSLDTASAGRIDARSWSAVVDGFPPPDGVVAELVVEVIDADAGSGVVGVVAKQAVGFQEGAVIGGRGRGLSRQVTRGGRNRGEGKQCQRPGGSKVHLWVYSHCLPSAFILLRRVLLFGIRCYKTTGAESRSPVTRPSDDLDPA